MTGLQPPQPPRNQPPGDHLDNQPEPQFATSAESQASTDRATLRALGRLYFAAQALAGAVWWVAVFTVPAVRAATLGAPGSASALDPVLIAAFDIPLFVIASAVAAIVPPTTRSRLSAAATLITTGWALLVALGMAIHSTITAEAGPGAAIMIVSAAASVFAACWVTLGCFPTDRILVGPFAFKQAINAERLSPLARTMIQLVLFWGLFLLVIPLIIRALEQRWGLSIDIDGPATTLIPEPTLELLTSLTTGLGIIVLIGASALGICSAVTMARIGEGTPLPSDMAQHLVIRGPYRFIRNPMAVAGIAQGAAVGLLLGSWAVVIYALAGSIVWNTLIRPVEEADLEERFGDEFREYEASVACWVPRRIRAA